jgi:hypothetical protein
MSKRLDNKVAIVFGAGSVGKGWRNRRSRIMRGGIVGRTAPGVQMTRKSRWLVRKQAALFKQWADLTGPQQWSIGATLLGSVATIGSYVLFGVRLIFYTVVITTTIVIVSDGIAPLSGLNWTWLIGPRWTPWSRRLPKSGDASTSWSPTLVAAVGGPSIPRRARSIPDCSILSCT